jgi:hypothetical protein
MTIETPARPDQTTQDLDALIAEARRRARRRRVGYAAAIGVLLAIAAVVVFVGGEDTRQAPDEGNARPGALAGGSDVLFARAVVDSREAVFEIDLRADKVKRLRIPASCGDTPSCLISTGGELIVSSVGRTTTYNPAASTQVARIGNGWITVPSARDGRLWLGILARGKLGGPHRRGLSQVREVNLAGKVIRSMRPPDGRWPLGAVTPGLLFQYPGTLRLWSLAERRLTLRIPGAFPIDTSESLVASCGDPCRGAVVTDTRTQESIRIAPPAGYRWVGGYDGGFSPDGSHLALPIARAGEGLESSPGLAVINVSTRAVHVIPGSDEVDPIYGAMTWSSDGGRLFFATDDGAVMSYSLGSDRLTAHAAFDANDLILQIVSLRPHE